jgi:uncharacterized protein (TIGR02246 family)
LEQGASLRHANRKEGSVPTIFPLLLLLAQPALPQATPTVAQAIERDAGTLAKQFETTWNLHDAQAFAALFADTADYVGPDERTVVGRDEIQKTILHRNAKDATKEATASVTVLSVRLVRNDVAIADWSVIVRNLRSLDGTLSPPETQRATVVMTKESGAWTISSMRAGRPRPSTPEEIGGLTGGLS